jgi:hypothetical protein
MDNTDLHDSRDVSAAEKLLIFLFICSNGVKFRIVSETFQHSTRTVNRAFHQVLQGLLRLYELEVVLPAADKTPDKIEQDNKFWPYFADCIGAVDGSLLRPGFLVKIKRLGGVERALYRKMCWQPATLK